MGGIARRRGHGVLRRLERDRRGSMLVELAAGVFILMLFTVGLARFGALAIDVDRDARALKAGVDLVLVLDDETSAPAQADVDGIAAALLEVHGTRPHDTHVVHASVWGANASSQARLVWALSSGVDAPSNPTRAALSGGDVVVDGMTYDLRGGEELVVVEVVRSGRGLGASSRTVRHAHSVAYKRE